MRTFFAYIRKEAMESARQHRYIILLGFFAGFGILNPIMLKLLPAIIGDQLPEAVVAAMSFRAVDALQGYLKSLYQLGTLIISFTYMGLLADELGQNRLVFPVSQGARANGIVTAKFLSAAFPTVVALSLGMALCHYYSNILFPAAKITWDWTVRSNGLITVYYVQHLGMILFLSSMFRRGLGAGLVSLLVAYFTPLLHQVRALRSLVPYALIMEANSSGSAGVDIRITLLSSATLTIVFLALTVARMQRVEVVSRT